MILYSEDKRERVETMDRRAQLRLLITNTVAFNFFFTPVVKRR